MNKKRDRKTEIDKMQ